MLIGRSPVRISFAGGGTDLPAYYEQFGGAVLSTAINKYFYTILGKRSDGRVQVISSDLRVFETWQDIAAMKLEGSGLEIPLAVLKDVSSDHFGGSFSGFRDSSRHGFGLVGECLCGYLEDSHHVSGSAAFPV